MSVIDTGLRYTYHTVYLIHSQTPKDTYYTLDCIDDVGAANTDDDLADGSSNRDIGIGDQIAYVDGKHIIAKRCRPLVVDGTNCTIYRSASKAHCDASRYHEHYYTIVPKTPGESCYLKVLYDDGDGDVMRWPSTWNELVYKMGERVGDIYAFFTIS